MKDPRAPNVATAILAVLNRDIQESVPFFFRAKALAAAPQLANDCAIAALSVIPQPKVS